ncbi:MAG: hypothetical protein IJD82_06560 [Clostridia bacterium]|nr:hypothetical protein [Clostridia bacterium]
MPECTCCGASLTRNDVGATKKLINRGAEEFLCIPCLAKKFKVDEELIHKKIDEWRGMGCMLFD